MNMDIMTGGIGPEIPISPPSSRSDELESHNMALHPTDQGGKLPVWDIADDSTESHVSTSASPSIAEQESLRDDGGASDRMIEKWRSIKIADKNRAQKRYQMVRLTCKSEADVMRQVYRTDDTYTKMFGKNYSKFYEAFQQGIRPPEVRQIVATTVPAKRHSVAPAIQASKRRRQDDRVSPEQVDQHEAPVISLQRSTATADKSPPGAKPSEVASPPSDVRESSVRSTPKSYSAAKGKFISMINVPFASSANSYFG